jgi:RNA polymerase sigma-70 factor, ECF subfamily
MLAALLKTAHTLVRTTPAPGNDDPAIEGEIAALRPLVRAVVAAVLREPHDHPDVDDVTQEALRRAVEGAATGKSRPDGPARPWLLGVARHVALDTIRARRRDRARFDDGAIPDAPESQTSVLVERLADPGEGAIASLLEAERRDRVCRALARLPEGPRVALELFHGEGLAYAAIAKRLDVPVGTVATWVTRGRKTIADVLAQEDTVPQNPMPTRTGS